MNAHFLILVAAGLGCAGCLRQGATEREKPEAASREVATWTFDDDASATLLSLWPQEPGAPGRRKKDLLTSKRDDVLLTEVKGKDPYFLWRLSAPRRATAVTVELEGSTAGLVQVFWATEQCPTFRESCSAVQPLSAGEATLDFLLDDAVPLRGLRLDLPAVQGARYRIRSIRLLHTPRLRAGWVGREGHTAVDLTDEGMVVTSVADDPWVVVTTPGLHADRVASADVTIDGLAGTAAQLFWAGEACENFSGECTIRFDATDGGTTTLGADLAAHPKWSGAVTALRLDPGDRAGIYRVERVTFSR